MRITSGEVRPPPLPQRPHVSVAKVEPSEESSFAKLVRGLGREVDRGETMLQKAIAGQKDLGPTELLALQAGVYRYTEAVDLSAKLVDRATNGVKTVIQGQ